MEEESEVVLRESLTYLKVLLLRTNVGAGEED